MIETIADSLKWGLIIQDIGEEVARASREGLIQPEDFPQFSEIVVFVEVERWRKGQPSEWYRSWVIGFARSSFPIVLASVVRPAAYWVQKVRDLAVVFKANRIVALEDKVALCLLLSGIENVATARDFLDLHVRWLTSEGPEEPGQVYNCQLFCAKCGKPEAEAIHHPRHPGRHDFSLRR